MPECAVYVRNITVLATNRNEIGVAGAGRRQTSNSQSATSCNADENCFLVLTFAVECWRRYKQGRLLLAVNKRAWLSSGRSSSPEREELDKNKDV
jgi:hypothetical protein